MGKFKDLTGRKFGRLTAIKRHGYEGKQITWLCQCECGQEKVVGVSGLTTGSVKSCGCIKGHPDGFWKDLEKRQQYILQLGEKLNFNKPEDWYKITIKDFLNNEGRTVLRYYNHSLIEIVKELFPNYEWKEWLFIKAPNRFWLSHENRIRYMKWLENKMVWNIPENWYNLTSKILNDNNGHGLLKYHNMSLLPIVKEIYPSYEWKEWLFVTHVKNSFWVDPQNFQRYMDWLGYLLGYNSPEDWYKVTKKNFYQNGGGGLLNRYKNSCLLTVMSRYPDYNWKGWLFVSAPNSFWDDPKNRSEYMNWLGEKLRFQKPEDWYKVTKNDFESHKGGGLLSGYYQNSPALAVMTNFPTFDWQPEKFSYRAKKQKRLYQIVKKVFSGYDVKWNFKHQDMKFQGTNRPMELDIFIPSLNFAIEYQGEQHNIPVRSWGGIGALKKIQQRDKEKKDACQKHKIELIEVLHNWNGRDNTAIDIIKEQLINRVKNKSGETKAAESALAVITAYCNQKEKSK